MQLKKRRYKVKVLVITAVNGLAFKAVFPGPANCLDRIALGSSGYFQELGMGPRVLRMNTEECGSAISVVITMLTPARVGEQLLRKNETFMVNEGYSQAAVIGNIEFTFEIVDVD